MLLRGRPTKYKPEMKDEILALMAEGASKVEVAANLGIDRNTLYRWIKENEDFRDTIIMGETLCQAWWEKDGRKNLYNNKYNSHVWRLNMKCRFKDDWTEIQEHKIETNVSEELDKARKRMKEIYPPIKVSNEREEQFAVSENVNVIYTNNKDE